MELIGKSLMDDCLKIGSGLNLIVHRKGKIEKAE